MYTYETRTLFYAIYDIVFFYKESLSTCQRDASPFSALPCTVEKFILGWIINLLADSSIFSHFTAMHTENFTTGTHAPLSFIRLFVIYRFYFYSYPSVWPVLFQRSLSTVDRIDRRICNVATNQYTEYTG